MGPKTLSMLHREKGIGNLSELEKALEDGSLMGLFGIGEKKIETSNGEFCSSNRARAG